MLGLTRIETICQLWSLSCGYCGILAMVLRGTPEVGSGDEAVEETRICNGEGFDFQLKGISPSSGPGKTKWGPHIEPGDHTSRKQRKRG